ncbi:hypothetical protein BGZ61DRAFT_535408 [Ilyonectria robusta]|uniref:uncharacterized protein n=1 Tax=Ilyonectria robusta TaxID=1079257 RepID=UPI001E8DC602|nr:uncharacterized protein BGZ61DRAFT_535408 [Ilyonectria robusta]KAH8680338.1 hypothetical protein BGZ61DRAFT_535408 [Ilyonectria robusta]
MEAEAKNILQQLGDTSGWVTRATNFELTAYIVVPCRTPKDRDSPIPQIRQVLEATLQHTMVWSSQVAREQLDSAPDAFERPVKDSKEKEQNFYENPYFNLRRARDLPDAYSLEVHKYWYMSTLKQLGAREVRPSFCAFDGSWYAPIDSQRRGIKFTQPKTIAEGAGQRHFNIDRVKKTTER